MAMDIFLTREANSAALMLDSLNTVFLTVDRHGVMEGTQNRGRSTADAPSAPLIDSSCCSPYLRLLKTEYVPFKPTRVLSIRRRKRQVCSEEASKWASTTSLPFINLPYCSSCFHLMVVYSAPCKSTREPPSQGREGLTRPEGASRSMMRNVQLKNSNSM